jgi:GT2 family glycosyltransferase
MLSIVIPTHQRSDLLRACLASVTRHAPPQTEILVIDDASPGRSAGVVAREFPQVHLVGLPRRRGFCVAANTGIARARGEIVELLNDDTEVLAGWAEPALACFADPRVAAVAPLVLRWPDGQVVDSAGDCYYLGGVAEKRGHGQPLRPGHFPAGPVFGASASSAFFRRWVLHEVGAFPESFGAYFEDVDLAFRLQRAGFRTLFEPESRLLHRVGASHGNAGRRLVEQQSWNEERVFWRNLPGRTLARALPRHLAVLAGKAWRRWQEGTLAPFLCGRLRVLGELSALTQHRRRLKELGPAVPLTQWHVEDRFWGGRIKTRGAKESGRGLLK